jgi:hypothetical protein
MKLYRLIAAAAIAGMTANAGTITFTGAIQNYTVSATGIYDITVAGAQGGSDNAAIAGLGALIDGDVQLTAGPQLANRRTLRRRRSGRQGGFSSSGCCDGGGGGGGWNGGGGGGGYSVGGAGSGGAGIGPLKFSPVSADRREMNISAIALGGLKQAQSSLDSAAKRIASDKSLPSPNDGVVLIQVKNDSASNEAVLKTADDLERSTISLLG